jgi:hypothetical protein
MSKRSEVERIIQYLTTKNDSVEQLRTLLRAVEQMRKFMSPNSYSAAAYDRAKRRILGDE